MASSTVFCLQMSFGPHEVAPVMPVAARLLIVSYIDLEISALI